MEQKNNVDHQNKLSKTAYRNTRIILYLNWCKILAYIIFADICRLTFIGLWMS